MGNITLFERNPIPKSIILNSTCGTLTLPPRKGVGYLVNPIL
jgi:hypothetical protein